MKNTFRILALGVVLAAASTGSAFAQMASKASANPDSTMKQDSAQPGTDTWITTKVKSELMATKGIPSTEISVTTTNGNVTLSGVVETKAQVQKAIAVTQTVKGVHNVDSVALKARG
ncbi:MAG: BON domain-containing protein [Rudaea sp.]